MVKQGWNDDKFGPPKISFSLPQTMVVALFYTHILLNMVMLYIKSFLFLCSFMWYIACTSSVICVPTIMENVTPYPYCPKSGKLCNYYKTSRKCTFALLDNFDCITLKRLSLHISWRSVSSKLCPQILLACIFSRCLRSSLLGCDNIVLSTNLRFSGCVTLTQVLFLFLFITGEEMVMFWYGISSDSKKESQAIWRCPVNQEMCFFVEEHSPSERNRLQQQRINWNQCSNVQGKEGIPIVIVGYAWYI